MASSATCRFFSRAGTGIGSGDAVEYPAGAARECLTPKDCRKPRIWRPKSSKAESCTTNCVATRIYGGNGLQGHGLLKTWGPTFVFKEGFRGRRYCLVESSDICNLIGDEEYGP